MEDVVRIKRYLEDLWNRYDAENDKLIKLQSEEWRELCMMETEDDKYVSLKNLIEKHKSESRALLKSHQKMCDECLEYEAIYNPACLYKQCEDD
jgi:hypothetical protein